MSNEDFNNTQSQINLKNSLLQKERDNKIVKNKPFLGSTIKKNQDKKIIFE